MAQDPTAFHPLDHDSPTSSYERAPMGGVAGLSCEPEKEEFKNTVIEANERSTAVSQSYFSWLRDETAELYKYSLKTDVDGEGVIDVKSDDGDGEFYKMGAKVTLVAKPADNFVFKEWSGEGIINTGSETNELTVSSNSSVTARFVPSDAK